MRMLRAMRLLAVLAMGVLQPLAGARSAPAAPTKAGAVGAVERGERLFDGREPVAASLAGHAASLPPPLGACIACHGHAAPSSPLEARLAPPLGCTTLSRLQPRRGEPPVDYDRASFCQAVRTGTNPNAVILRRAMPRFALDQAQCDALWAYLTAKGAGCHDAR